MANRDYKNIKRFVENVSEETATTMATGGSLNISPFVIIQAGSRVTIDFSKRTWWFDWPHTLSDSGEAVAVQGEDVVAYYLQKAGNQVIASLICGEYQTVSNEVVIYEGSDVEDASDTRDLKEHPLPTVEFTISDTYTSKTATVAKDGDIIVRG